MGAFEYTAVDTSGRERKGVLEGDTARQVRQLLRDQSLLPVTVNEVQQQEKHHRSRSGFKIRRGVSASDLSLLTRQLSTLVRSGLPLEEALQAVSEQTEKPRINRACRWKKRYKPSPSRPKNRASKAFCSACVRK
jgi:general secretion pathway protein F